VSPPRILVVFHSRSGSTRSLCEAVVAGLEEGCPEGERRVLGAFDAGIDDVRWADGIVLGTPTHFGYMSGALKDFFERIYRPLLEETVGRPWTMFVKGESDVDGCVRSIERIVTGLRWKQVLPPVLVVGELTEADLAAAHELGATLAAGLDLGVL
jgi:menaquinone-dependent protoporphyrinogen IX oxidase